MSLFQTPSLWIMCSICGPYSCTSLFFSHPPQGLESVCPCHCPYAIDCILTEPLGPHICELAFLSVYLIPAGANGASSASGLSASPPNVPQICSGSCPLLFSQSRLASCFFFVIVLYVVLCTRLCCTMVLQKLFVPIYTSWTEK